MNLIKANIIARLQKEIISLQTTHAALATANHDFGLGSINNAFPEHRFPTGAIHEFISASQEDTAATIGFISGIAGNLMQHKGTLIWINTASTIFPPALKNYGIAPDKVIFIALKKEKEILWAMEEALKCDAVAAVVADIPNLNFTASRRLQLAVEKSNVTGFIIRQTKNTISPTICVSRWKITSLPTEFLNEMPGVGFPRWNIELLKIRNGKPGQWKLEWINGTFNHVTENKFVVDQDTHEKIKEAV